MIFYVENINYQNKFLKKIFKIHKLNNNALRSEYFSEFYNFQHVKLLFKIIFLNKTKWYSFSSTYIILTYRQI